MQSTLVEVLTTTQHGQFISMHKENQQILSPNLICQCKRTGISMRVSDFELKKLWVTFNSNADFPKMYTTLESNKKDIFCLNV